MKPNIAIDGPAGAGKSTVARLAAEKLGLVYIDTGAMYRALTWKALQQNLPFEETALARLARTTRIRFANDEGVQKVFCDDTDVTEQIREPLVTKWVSVLSSFAPVRRELTNLQRKAAASGGVVMDGRDIGTAVLPDASFKFFLTASLEERSRRRYREMVNKGTQISLAEIEADIAARDQADRNRKVAPLVQAEDAIVIDTTDLSVEQVVDLIVAKYSQEVE
ncbi:MAG: (d)CMP kinase [Clostridia bacterium]|nr:(d)CMP kinase [Clostridia bacterium]